LHILEVPRGVLTDSAEIAFSPDGLQLAFSAGFQALLFNLESGRVERSWDLPGGLDGGLAFTDDNRLISARTETRDPRKLPLSNAVPTEFPRVVHVRNLMGSDSLKPLCAFDEFNWTVYAMGLSRDGRYLAIEGTGGPLGESRLARLYEASTGKLLGPLVTEVSRPPDGSVILFDPTGSVLGHVADPRRGLNLYAVPSRTLIREDVSNPISLSAGARRWLRSENSIAFDGRVVSFALHQFDRNAPLVHLAMESELSGRCPFGPDPCGRFFAQGNRDGSVKVADLETIQRRLSQFSLGW
jgi:hypothetical protein